MKLKKLYIATLLGISAAGFGLSSCADDLAVKSSDTDFTEGIVLRIPNIEAAADASSRAAGMDASADEGKLNSLYLYVFQQNGADWNIVKKYKGDIASSIQNSDNSKEYKDYDLPLDPGKYKIYLLANLEDYVSDVNTLKNINTIDDIKDLSLTFTGPLSQSNLPMACLSTIAKNAEPTLSDREIEVTGNEAMGQKIIYAHLSFLCSKVRYTILFDRNATGSQFKENAHVVDFDGTVEVKDVLMSSQIKEAYDKWGDLTYKDAEGDLNKFSLPSDFDPDEIVDLTGSKNSWSSSDNDTRAWQGIIYLPENTNTGKKTSLTFNGDCFANPTSTQSLYEIQKEVVLSPGKSSDDGKLTRSMMYDVLLTVLNDNAVDATVTVADWNVESLLADFVHTYLTVESTKVSVTSTEGVSIPYSTDGRGGMKFECAVNDEDNNLQWSSTSGKSGEIKADTDPIILGSFETVNGVPVLTLKANPSVPIYNIKADSEGYITGTALCYITAGNIKKQIAVNYNLSPYFEITPGIQKIRYASGSSELEKVFEYETNLGGIVLKGRTGQSNASTIFINSSKTSSVSTVSQSSITISCTDPSSGKGSITVKATTDPKETTVHLFTAEPANQPTTAISTNLEVQVMPPYGNYFIYFRAINDYQANGNGNEFLGRDYSKWPIEGNSNWTDWWSEDNNRTSSANNHRIYIYGQNGETLDTNEDTGAWEFNGPYKDDDYNNKMTPSSSNAGWYSYELKWNQTPTDIKHSGSSLNPEPGKTLLMFYAGRNNIGEEIHRAPHHMDAGITLFDYEDREGWILYDPTCAPYSKTYDSKPIIEDVNYIVYTKSPVYSWHNKYGNIDGGMTTYDDNHGEWVIHYTLKDNECEELGNGWYRTIIKLKAPKDDYAKNIKINTLNTNGKYRVYFKKFKNDNNWGDRSPRVHLFGGSKGEKNSWNNSEEMTYIGEADDHNGWIYYYDIPYGYHDGKIVFCSNDRSTIQTDDITLNMYANIIYCSQNNPKTPSHQEYGYKEYYNTIISSTKLFNGEAYPNNTGYFNNSAWSPSAN
ncbi:MAG: hypothetical protein J1F16_04560 [Muribaculaceae bacterium]|nr:hypothetical protein [Muribaculaceae bacterium]